MTEATFKSHCRAAGACLEWHGPAFVRVDGAVMRPARAALVYAGVYVRPGLLVVPTCGNAACVKREHLEPVTRREWGKRHSGNLAPPFVAGGHRKRAAANHGSVYRSAE